MPTEHHKLVRDRIPELVREDGKTPVTRRVDGADRERRLAAKLIEEAEEYRESRRPEELADVLAVVYALCDHHGVDRATLQQRREQKAERRGGFGEGVVLERVVDGAAPGGDGE
jgi:predicted house-cleaning noncanonical NTP pyrophosphatase (MazG superfamily)